MELVEEGEKVEEGIIDKEADEWYRTLSAEPEYSQVPREKLLEIIHLQLRQRDRMVERSLHKKYLAFIQKRYVALHPQLHKLENWEFEESFEKYFKEDNHFDNFPMKEEMPGVFSFPLLKLSTCQRILEEVDNFENWCLRNGVTVNRPNSMNNYGAILDDFGFDPVFNEITEKIINPLAYKLYRHIGPTCDDHHGFIVEYALKKDLALGFHVDDSEVTLNVCLGTEFGGGDLFFAGVRCQRHKHMVPTEKESFQVPHQVGRAIIHLGKHRHSATPITFGKRVNLILWNQSSKFRTASKGSEDICPDWCPIEEKYM